MSTEKVELKTRVFSLLHAVGFFLVSSCSSQIDKPFFSSIDNRQNSFFDGQVRIHVSEEWVESLGADEFDIAIRSKDAVCKGLIHLPTEGAVNYSISGDGGYRVVNFSDGIKCVIDNDLKEVTFLIRPVFQYSAHEDNPWVYSEFSVALSTLIR